MSSFFTRPASQKKRKRPLPSVQNPLNRGPPAKRGKADDDSISGSDLSSGDDTDAPAARADHVEYTDSENDEFEDEDPAAKRIRLAEQYLANTQKEVSDLVGFDAADVDAENLRQRMGERLKEDTAESKGKIFRWIANELNWDGAEATMVRMDGKSVIGVAVQGSSVYAASRDMALSKWELTKNQGGLSTGEMSGRGKISKKMKRVRYTRGNAHKKDDREFLHHHRPILCIAAGQDGKFVVTGGADNKLIVWDAATLRPLKVFTQHRDSVTSLGFRRGSNQLFSASKDRTVKVWSLDELAYVDTLFGHQDDVVDVSALAQEACVTVGARDRTARLWKVIEATQLVFRGGGAPSAPKNGVIESRQHSNGVDVLDKIPSKPYNEGSMDRVACLDDETFVTGSDNGSISLWNVHKKKPVFTYPLAHGLDPPLPLSWLSAETEPDEQTVYREPQPRWITALQSIPFTDTFVSGSWDGYVRAWRISPDKRRIEPLGPLGRAAEHAHAEVDEFDIPRIKSGSTAGRAVPGIVNDLAITDRGERGKDGVLVVAAMGKEPRLGRWMEIRSGKNGIVVYEVPRKCAATGDETGIGNSSV